jgi:hypothetical protein
LISSDYAENWPQPVQSHLKRLMGDHLISACTQTLSFTKMFIRRTNCLVCRRVLCALCTECTLHSNHRLTRVIFQHTKRLLPHGAAIFSLHTLASPSGRNVNYDEKQLTGKKIFLTCSFYLYRFRKHLSYVFLIINFCNPGSTLYKLMRSNTRTWVSI